MASYVFYLFLAYLLYNVIFKFVLPVYRTTRQVKRSFKDMQSRMQGQGQQPPVRERSSKKPAAKASAGDYIEFEEVRE
ncbi:MAG: hypothetical protein WKF70_04230 [Chitinophagaceae bacterium]